MSNAAATHFLIVGDETDLPLLREVVGRLPVDAYGQMFVEVGSAAQVEIWGVPTGLSVTWLVHAESRDWPAWGELAARAVLGWIEEWMPDQRESHVSPYVMWIGCATSSAMDQLYRQLDERLDGVHLHHPHHD